MFPKFPNVLFDTAIFKSIRNQSLTLTLYKLYFALIHGLWHSCKNKAPTNDKLNLKLKVFHPVQ